MKIYKSGYLKIDDIHEIYFECKWNPKSQPILFLHWWPGAWFSIKDEQFFDLENHNIIFFDQRWAWRSRWKKFKNQWDNNEIKRFYNEILNKGLANISFEEYISLVNKEYLINNTTWDLIDDINKLLDFLWIEKVHLFWGSWWSALALVYSINFPERVKSMVLRGIYLPVPKIYDDFFFWNGVEKIYSDIWEEFINNFPEKIRSNKRLIVEYIKNQMDNWNLIYNILLDIFETKIMYLDWRKVSIDPYEEKDIRAAIIEFRYLYNWCFLEKNYILKNAYKLENIPIKIVQGRYDLVCPPEDAYKLYKALPKSKLEFVLWWHSAYDEEVFKKLKEFVEKI